ncbi:MAG TPA: hypothetical protein VGV38_23065, partial [Pyrinomonadaceae bacterium]|nr:hypothetical protein [Pyrinomonadaceae bacterium]
MNYFNYFTEIEDAFVRRRGKHLLLSPMDWALIESWKQMGVPLHVALRGIEKAFDSYEARPRKRSVKTLLYCQEEVEAQFEEWRESQLGAPAVAAEENGRAEPADGRMSNLPFPREAILAHLSQCRAALARVEAGGELKEAVARAGRRLEELEQDFAR